MKHAETGANADGDDRHFVSRAQDSRPYIAGKKTRQEGHRAPSSTSNSFSNFG